MDTSGAVAYVLEHCGIYFSVFFKHFMDVVFMVRRHLELTKMTGAILGFGKTLLSAPYNILVMSVLTSLYDPDAPALAAVEEERKIFVMRRSYKIYEMILRRRKNIFTQS